MAVAAGSTNLFFSKETRVFLAQDANIWEIPVLDGYSFAQNTNTSDVTLAEMADSAGTSRRGRRMFTDSYAPAEWSFESYARPFLVGGNMSSVDEPLWANFVAANEYATGTWEAGVTRSATTLDFDFAASNKILLGSFDLYFVLGAAGTAGLDYGADGDTTVMKVNGAVINEASLSFDVEGITTIGWSGFGSLLEEVPEFDATGAIVQGIAQTNNFIRNRLTQLSAVSSVSGTSKTYDITLTGGSVTINNGITYLTPETIGRVNQPLGHVTGTRSVSGNFTAYLDEKINGTIDLFDDISKAKTAITNKFALDIYVGGKATGDAPAAPGIQFKIPNAHLSLPTHDISDVIGVDIAFNALPTSIGATDEISKISYVGV